VGEDRDNHLLDIIRQDIIPSVVISPSLRSAKQGQGTPWTRTQYNIGMLPGLGYNFNYIVIKCFINMHIFYLFLQRKNIAAFGNGKQAFKRIGKLELGNG